MIQIAFTCFVTDKRKIPHGHYFWIERKKAQEKKTKESKRTRKQAKQKLTNHKKKKVKEIKQFKRKV